MVNGTKPIHLSGFSEELIIKLNENALKKGGNLSLYCREILANHIYNNNPQTNEEHPYLSQIVTYLKIGGAFALLLFIIFLIFAGIIAINYLKQTGGI